MAELFRRIANSGIETALQSAWQMLGGMVWAAIGGVVITGLSALIGHIGGYVSPVWIDRALTALVAFGSIAVVGIIQAIVHKVRGPRTATIASPPTLPSPEAELTEIVNQSFRNQEVLLDGHQYISCTFENVTFVYNNGITGGFDSSSRWTGSVGFKSREPRIQQILGFLQSLKIIPPQTTRGLYMPILADLPNPANDFVIVKTPSELVSYWSRLVSARQTSCEKFADMANSYEYVLNFWNKLENNKNTDKQIWFEKSFPAQSLTPEQIDEFRDKFLAGAKAFRLSLVTLLNLLAFQFPKLEA